jgi:hypothetical protein
LHAGGYKDIEILIFEDQTPLLPLWFDIVSWIPTNMTFLNVQIFQFYPLLRHEHSEQ